MQSEKKFVFYKLCLRYLGLIFGISLGLWTFFFNLEEGAPDSPLIAITNFILFFAPYFIFYVKVKLFTENSLREFVYLTSVLLILSLPVGFLLLSYKSGDFNFGLAFWIFINPLIAFVLLKFWFKLKAIVFERTEVK